MSLSDDVLWNRVGDTDAFGELFERHARAIYNYCFRSIGDLTAAEDLLSLVFLEAWRQREKELAEGLVLPWLYGIATNVIRNRRRSERRFAAFLRRLPAQGTEPDFAEDAERRVDYERQMKQALALLDRLPQHERETFILCAWMELDYEAAAAALHVPVGTVRSRLSRARAHLGELHQACGHIQGKSVAKEVSR